MKRDWVRGKHKIAAYVGSRFKYVVWLTASHCIATETLAEMFSALDQVR